MGGPLVARAVAAKASRRRHGGRVLNDQNNNARENPMAAVPMRKLRTWQDKIQTDVLVLGDGPPLVYLHGPWGLRADHPFLEVLAGSHTVYAPKHPGTSDGDPDAIHELDHWWDLIVYYGELFDRLDLAKVVLVGHSYGGMLACEIAAANPERVSKLVLIDPVGLWRDDLPVKNWMILSNPDLRKALFQNPTGEIAQKFFGFPTENDARVEAQVGFIWSQACTGKFVWPIPDKGLKKHIHRIGMPTLLIWGKGDGVIAPAYADEFARRIANSRVTMIDDAGHLPHLEQPEKVNRAVRDFLSA
jgi:pimeloyl-ACP methyl ester carboxylesterase